MATQLAAMATSQEGRDAQQGANGAREAGRRARAHDIRCALALEQVLWSAGIQDHDNVADIDGAAANKIRTFVGNAASAAVAAAVLERQWQARYGQRHSPGTVVTLHGLRRYPWYNGRQAVVRYYAATTGRYVLDLVGHEVLVTPRNTMRASPAEEAAVRERRATAAAGAELAPPGGLAACLQAPSVRMTTVGVAVMHGNGYMLVGVENPHADQRSQRITIPTGALRTDVPLWATVDAVLIRDAWLTMVEGAMPATFLRCEVAGKGCVLVHVPLAKLRTHAGSTRDGPRLAMRHFRHIDAMADAAPTTIPLSAMLRTVVKYDHQARSTGVAGLPWCLPVPGAHARRATLPVPPAHRGGPGREVSQMFPTLP